MASHSQSHDSGGSLTFTSWNVKGLNALVKLNKVLGHLKQLDSKIAFLQETHLTVTDHRKLCKGWVGQMYHSSFGGRSRGAAILIHKSVPFSATKTISDPYGRYVIVVGRIHNTPLILANVYGPNWDNDAFFRKFLFSLPDLDSHRLIIGGDFNCCLDPILYRSSPTAIPLSKSGKIIKIFLEQYALSDPWRLLNPNERKYSFFSPVHQTYSRIDYFIIDKKCMPSVHSCSYGSITISDHAPVILRIFLLDRSTSRSPWRFNTLLLSDEDFVQYFVQLR